VGTDPGTGKGFLPPTRNLKIFPRIVCASPEKWNIVADYPWCNGATLLYNKATQEFAVLHKNGTIVTYMWA